MDARREISAAVERLRRFRDEDPTRYSAIITHVGLPAAVTVIGLVTEQPAEQPVDA